MLNLLYGWYANQYLGARHINLVWRENLLANATGTFSLTDAVDGTNIKNDLVVDDLLIYEAVTYADSGTVSIDIRPDDNGAEKFTVDATQTQTRVAITPPKLVESDVVLDYENEAVVNSFIMNISALEISRSNLVKLTEMSRGLANMQYLNNNLITVQQESVEILKALANIYAAVRNQEPPYTIDYDSVLSSVGLKEVSAATRNFCRRKRS